MSSGLNVLSAGRIFCAKASRSSAPPSPGARGALKIFPTPVSDRVHDAYFVFSFLRALDQVDALKSAAPMLGSAVTLDYDAARLKRMAADPETLEAVTAELVHYLSGMFIWGHPRSQINVVPSPTIPSIIGGLLPSIYNPNLVSEESSRHSRRPCQASGVMACGRPR